MKNINIFCLIGRSGSGKSFYLDKIKNDKEFINENNISFLVYNTTRAKRLGERNGIDYNFYTEEEYNKINKSNIIETREYTLADGSIVHYFTKVQDFSYSGNIICTASPYQYRSYKKFCDEINKKPSNIYMNIYTIEIDASARVRLDRGLKRISFDNDDDRVYECCRRIVDEQKEFSEVSNSLIEDDLYLKNRFCILNEKPSQVDFNYTAIKGFIIRSIESTSK